MVYSEHTVSGLLDVDESYCSRLWGIIMFVNPVSVMVQLTRNVVRNRKCKFKQSSYIFFKPYVLSLGWMLGEEEKGASKKRCPKSYTGILRNLNSAAPFLTSFTLS